MNLKCLLKVDQAGIADGLQGVWEEDGFEALGLNSWVGAGCVNADEEELGWGEEGPGSG